MATMVPPQKNVEYIFYISLVSQADTKLFQNNPTLASGDVKVSTDGGALSNLDTLPVVTPASSDNVKVTVSATEMNGDNIHIVFSDVAGAEWCDMAINIQTAAQSLDTMDTNIDDIETDTNEIQGKLPTNKFMGSSDGADDDGTLNTIAGDVVNVDGSSIPTVVQIQTELEENGASLLDIIRDELANATDGLSALKTLIDNLQTQVDTTGVALLAGAVDDIWDEVLSASAHNVGASSGKRLRAAGHDTTISRENTCQAGEDSTHVKLDSGASATDEFYAHMWIYLVSGTGSGQVRLIDDYVGSTKVGEIHPPWLTNPDGGTDFLLMARAETNVHDIDAEGLASIQAELEENGASILDTLQDRLTSIRAGNLDQLDFTLQEAIAAIPTTMRGTDNVVLAGPTKAEMDTAHALLATPAQVATELGTYDAPTKAEMDAALLIMKQKVAGAFDRETDSLEAIRDRGDTAWVTGAGGDATEAKQDIIDTVVDAIRVVIDKLADTLELDGAVYRFTLNALEEAPSGTGGDASEANQLLLIKILTNKWEVTGNQFILYDDDGTTPLYTFDLTQDGIATEFNPDLRTPV